VGQWVLIGVLLVGLVWLYSRETPRPIKPTVVEIDGELSVEGTKAPMLPGQLGELELAWQLGAVKPEQFANQVRIRWSLVGSGGKVIARGWLEEPSSKEMVEQVRKALPGTALPVVLRVAPGLPEVEGIKVRYKGSVAPDIAIGFPSLADLIYPLPN